VNGEEEWLPSPLFVYCKILNRNRMSSLREEYNEAPFAIKLWFILALFIGVSMLIIIILACINIFN